MAGQRGGSSALLGQGLPHLVADGLLVLPRRDLQHRPRQLRAASRPGRTRRGTVPGHLYGYQLAHGVIPRLGWGTNSPTVCHTCDNHSCHQPTHLRLGTAAENRAEWLARRKDPGSPLADLRGPAGRSRAIGAAIRAGQERGESEAEITARIRAAIRAGRPLSLW